MDRGDESHMLLRQRHVPQVKSIENWLGLQCLLFVVVDKILELDVRVIYFLLRAIKFLHLLDDQTLGQVVFLNSEALLVDTLIATQNQVCFR